MASPTSPVPSRSVTRVRRRRKPGDIMLNHLQERTPQSGILLGFALWGHKTELGEKAMGNNSSYIASNVSIGLDAEVQRLKTQAIMGWEKEFRTLKWFGLKDRMKILEVGSGPGFITEQLLIKLPNSQITALEIDELLINKAKKLLYKYNDNQLQFVHSSIIETGLSNDTYDFVIARMLFLHLLNPVQAAKEVFRVLKPGGKLVIIDIDDGIWGAVEPDLKELTVILNKFAEIQKEVGGNRHIGRSLLRVLKESGYVNLDIESVINHSDLLGMDIFKPQFDINRITGLYNKGIINDEQMNKLRSFHEMIFQSTDAYAMLVFLLVCGTKPNA